MFRSDHVEIDEEEPRRRLVEHLGQDLVPDNWFIRRGEA